MEQRHYDALRAWLNQTVADEFTNDWRTPFQKIMGSHEGFHSELNRVYFRCVSDNYWFFQRWTWWQNTFWNEAERSFYREIVENRAADRRRLPAILAGMLVAYSKEPAPAPSDYTRYDMFRRVMRRHLERSLGLWFWQRWWGWGLGAANFNTPRSVMLQFWQLSFLDLPQLKAHELSFTTTPHPAPSYLPAAGLPGAVPAYRKEEGRTVSAEDRRLLEEAMARALARAEVEDAPPAGTPRERQEALLDRFRRGESVSKSLSTLADLYGLELSALRGQGIAQLDTIMKGLDGPRRRLWLLVHEDSRKREFSGEVAKQFQALLSDEALDWLKSKLSKVLKGEETESEAKWTLDDELRWLANYKKAVDRLVRTVAKTKATLDRVEALGEATRETLGRVEALGEATRETLGRVEALGEATGATLDRVERGLAEFKAEREAFANELDAYTKAVSATAGDGMTGARPAPLSAVAAGGAGAVAVAVAAEEATEATGIGVEPGR